LDSSQIDVWLLEKIFLQTLRVKSQDFAPSVHCNILEWDLGLSFNMPINPHEFKAREVFLAPIQWTNFIGNDLYLLLLRCPLASLLTKNPKPSMGTTTVF